jgi:CheY-like chemotaxis protein
LGAILEVETVKLATVSIKERAEKSMHSLDQKVALNNLPFLRRYARALLGSQNGGDALVLSTIHDLTKVKSQCLGNLSRVELFKRFTWILHSPAGQHIQSLTPPVKADSAVERRLASLSSILRQAFLLSSVEGFSNDHITEILNSDLASVMDLLAQAKQEILRQVSTRVLIIEDEMFIAADLEDIVTSLGHQVVAIERTHASAVKAIEATKPGLILADIQLADGSSGIDAVNEILLVCEVPVIFITAYPERLLTGLRPEPTFVLTKPFRDEAVRAVVSESLFFEARSKSALPRKGGAATATPQGLSVA